MKPLLSILIATRNRIPYCITVIETILSFEYDNFELVIQDNSDTLELKNYIASIIPDKRLVYNYTPTPFSSIDNFNAVIGLAKGEYLCLIGDDDGINQEIFKVVEWASKKKIDSIVPELNAIYWWPSACAEIERLKTTNGIVEIAHITGDIKMYDTSNELKKLMKNGGNYLDLNMPKLYHGIVKKELMDKIKEHIGYYVGGLSPDIYTAVALTFFVKKIIKIDYPLTISGICIASTSADSATNKNTGRLEDTPHFRDRGYYSWSEQVPKFYSGINIWADSALASLNNMKRSELTKKFSVTVLTIKLLLRHKEYSDLIFDNYYHHKNAICSLKKVYYLSLLSLKTLQLKFINLFNRGIKKMIRMFIQSIYFRSDKIFQPANYQNVENIKKATKMVNNHLLIHNISIDVIINNFERKFGNFKNRSANNTNSYHNL